MTESAAAINPLTELMMGVGDTVATGMGFASAGILIPERLFAFKMGLKGIQLPKNYSLTTKGKVGLGLGLASMLWTGGRAAYGLYQNYQKGEELNRIDTLTVLSTSLSLAAMGVALHPATRGLAIFLNGAALATDSVSLGYTYADVKKGTASWGQLALQAGMMALLGFDSKHYWHAGQYFRNVNNPLKGLAHIGITTNEFRIPIPEKQANVHRSQGNPDGVSTQLEKMLRAIGSDIVRIRKQLGTTLFAQETDPDAGAMTEHDFTKLLEANKAFNESLRSALTKALPEVSHFYALVFEANRATDPNKKAYFLYWASAIWQHSNRSNALRAIAHQEIATATDAAIKTMDWQPDPANWSNDYHFGRHLLREQRAARDRQDEPQAQDRKPLNTHLPNLSLPLPKPKVWGPKHLWSIIVNQYWELPASRDPKIHKIGILTAIKSYRENEKNFLPESNPPPLTYLDYFDRILKIPELSTQSVHDTITLFIDTHVEPSERQKAKDFLESNDLANLRRFLLGLRTEARRKGWGEVTEALEKILLLVPKR